LNSRSTARASAAFALLALLVACGCMPAHQTSDAASAPRTQTRQGNLSNRRGTATIREPFAARPDDPATTNDESNDQPLGHFGTVTLIVSQEESGNTYTLDVEVEDGAVERIYFPRGGWVDLDGCELESDLTGECVDENGKHWTFGGPNK
jgi:hypothetical protein